MVSFQQSRFKTILAHAKCQFARQTRQCPIRIPTGTKNRQQSNIQSSLESRQLQVAYDKAYSAVQELRNGAFDSTRQVIKKTCSVFAEGLLAPDLLFNSLTVLTNAAYNLTSARMNVWLAHQKILINNQIK